MAAPGVGVRRGQATRSPATAASGCAVPRAGGAPVKGRRELWEAASCGTVKSRLVLLCNQLCAILHGSSSALAEADSAERRPAPQPGPSWGSCGLCMAINRRTHSSAPCFCWLKRAEAFDISPCVPPLLAFALDPGWRSSAAPTVSRSPLTGPTSSSPRPSTRAAPLHATSCGATPYPRTAAFAPWSAPSLQILARSTAQGTSTWTACGWTRRGACTSPATAAARS